MDKPETNLVVGIDLGTTNSEIAAYVDGRVRVLGPGTTKILPSCVAFSPGGELLVGDAARNQQLIYPHLTVRSIKRRMGSDEKVALGENTFSPQEISALILRELAKWAFQQLGRPVQKAIITVPAYFSDAQRNATREAGALADLDVIRILNEPTAASLAYGFGEKNLRTVMVYDLGGGTFDVSIVNIENEVTEVLASHGNNHLGGDDFDQLLFNRLAEVFKAQEGIDLRFDRPIACARLWRAAEEAKKRLSFEPYVTVREENLISQDGISLHLNTELSRGDYEEMIRPMIESTLDSVSKALDQAGTQPGQLDAILLVGGATRTPLIWKVLEDKTGIRPLQEIHPDLCVALGAGVLASRHAGHDVERVLVDVSPYSFGPSHRGERNGTIYDYCYHPIIEKNTPLPVTRTESYCTAEPYQTAVEVEVFQGDDPDALKNIPIGNFCIEGLTEMYEPNEVLCRMNLDLDGILHVTAIEKCSEKSKHITITNSLQPKSEAELASARSRIQELYSSRAFEPEGVSYADPDDEEDWTDLEPKGQETEPERGAEVGGKVIEFGFTWTHEAEEAKKLLDRSRTLLETVHDEDKEELIDLHERIVESMSRRSSESLATGVKELKELLFFIEGK